MGRNPAVGRQGPGYHAAVIPSPAEAARLRVRQIRSTIGHPDTMRRTLVALGLRRTQAEVEVGNTPSIRGMLHKVRHLVEVSAVGPAAESPRRRRS